MIKFIYSCDGHLCIFSEIELKEAVAGEMTKKKKEKLEK